MRSFCKYFVLAFIFFIIGTTPQFAFESGKISAGKDYSLYIDNKGSLGLGE